MSYNSVNTIYGSIVDNILPSGTLKRVSCLTGVQSFFHSYKNSSIVSTEHNGNPEYCIFPLQFPLSQFRLKTS